MAFWKTFLIALLLASPATADRLVMDDNPDTSSWSWVSKDARCVPEFEAGKPIGYRCFQIKPGSIYDQIGIKDNDVIYNVGGEATALPASFKTIMLGLENVEKDVSVAINRDGKEMNLVFKPIKKISVKAKPVKANSQEAKSAEVAK